MKRNDTRFFYFVFIGAGLLIAWALAWSAQPAQAQCGTQASSCKDCHETQAQMPVNASGAWHTDHAFGDFCGFCHAGNVQSADQDEAHAGMAAPLEDVDASCVSCHPTDAAELAQVYADELGVEAGSGGGGGAADAGEESSSASEGAPPAALAAAMTVVSDDELIDYIRQYEEAAGCRPLNRGDVIVLLLIGLTLVGGGAFVFWNERRLALARPTAAKDLLPRLEQLEQEDLQALE